MTEHIDIHPAVALMDRARQDPPHWKDERILAWDAAYYESLRPFVSHKYWCCQASVNIFCVVGTRHADYAGLTWLELLHRGKHMPYNLHLHAENPHYYRDTAPRQPSMPYESWDGLNFYVAGDGNHRTCIARFDLFYREASTLHGVEITQYRVDEEWRLLYVELSRLCTDRRLGARCDMIRQLGQRRDTAGWMLENYGIHLQVQDRHGTRLLNKAAAQQLLAHWQKPQWRRWVAKPTFGSVANTGAKDSGEI